MSFKKVCATVMACALALGTMAMTASADDSYEAFLMFSAGDGQEGAGGHWTYGAAANAGDTVITGNGQYTVSYTMPEDNGAEQIDLILVQTSILDEAVTLTVNSITVGDTSVGYYGASDGALVMEGTDGLRVNIYNTWGNDVTDIDNVVEVPGGATVSVTFTVAGLANDAAEGEETGAAAPIVMVAALAVVSGVVVVSSKKRA